MASWISNNSLPIQVYVLNLKISTFSTTLLQPLRSLVDDMVAMSSLDLVRNPGWVSGEGWWRVGAQQEAKAVGKLYRTFWRTCRVFLVLWLWTSIQNTGNVCTWKRRGHLIWEFEKDTQRCLSKPKHEKHVVRCFRQQIIGRTFSISVDYLNIQFPVSKHI